MSISQDFLRTSLFMYCTSVCKNQMGDSACKTLSVCYSFCLRVFLSLCSLIRAFLCCHFHPPEWETRDVASSLHSALTVSFYSSLIAGQLRWKCSALKGANCRRADKTGRNDTWRFIFKSINEYFKNILQNNTKLNIALAKLRARFQQSTCRHCIFQHLDKVLCLLIYCLFNFSELSEWLKSTLIHELFVAKYSVNCKLNEGCIRLPWKNKVTFKNIGLLALNSLWLASDFLFRDEKLPLNDLVLPWFWTLISPLNVL